MIADQIKSVSQCIILPKSHTLHTRARSKAHAHTLTHIQTRVHTNGVPLCPDGFMASALASVVRAVSGCLNAVWARDIIHGQASDAWASKQQIAPPPPPSAAQPKPAICQAAFNKSFVGRAERPLPHYVADESRDPLQVGPSTRSECTHANFSHARGPAACTWQSWNPRTPTPSGLAHKAINVGARARRETPERTMWTPTGLRLATH